MRKQAFSLTLAVALVVTLLGNVQAQTPAPTPRSKIGIINIQRAIVETEEGKKAQEKLKADFAPKQSELRARQEEIEKLRKQLQEQERALSDEARANLVRQIGTKTRDFNRSREDFNSDGQQAQSEVLGKIGQKVLKVLEQYALENGYHVVIEIGSPQTPVVWANTAVDMTDDIIKRYNASSGASAATGATTGTSPAKPASTPGTPAARGTP
jgi:outer membrane protein